MLKTGTASQPRVPGILASELQSITGNLLGNNASSSWDKEHLWETA